MEGVTKDENEIYLELEPALLSKTLSALKSSNLAKSLKIKLTRKHETPCLSFEIELSSSLSNSTQLNAGSNLSSVCNHDFPVSLIPRRLWKDFLEPSMPAFDVSVHLPKELLKKLRHVSEKYKCLAGGKAFVVSANGEKGHLKLSLETDEVSVVTHFKNLEVSPLCASQQSLSSALSSQGEEEFVSIRVELKRFAQFLSADQTGGNKVILNLVAGRMIHMFLVNDDIEIQYFIPAIHCD